MAKFNYSIFTVDVLLSTGRIGYEIKAKDENNAIKQIKKLVADSNSPENLKKSWLDRLPQIKEVFWDTLTLDRTGYIRRY